MTDEIFLALIPREPGERITSKYLEKLTGMTGSEVRAKINSLRRDGHPIGSDCRGYYMATTQWEILRTIRNLDSRIKAINRAKEGLRNAMFNLIFEEENEQDARAKD